MSDVTLPNDWTPSATIYSGIFDGNGYKLIGGNAMTQPVFRETNDAVFYRVNFTGFTMTRSPSNIGIGSLVDNFGSASGNARMLDCYIQGKLTVTSATLVYPFIGGSRQGHGERSLWRKSAA